MSQPHVSIVVESEVTDGLMAPMMLIMPELQELWEESVPPQSMVHKEVDSLGVSGVPSMKPSFAPSKPLVSEAFFAEVLCDLLITWEAAIPGSRKRFLAFCQSRLRETKSRG
jgi:hypothetical protein